MPAAIMGKLFCIRPGMLDIADKSQDSINKGLLKGSISGPECLV